MPPSYPPLRSTGRLRVALVGAGRMGERHARAITELSDLYELTFVTDAEPERARLLCTRYGGAPTTFLDEAIAGADVVLVATPAPAHERAVVRSLCEGRAVLVEKPLALSVEAADRMLRAAHDTETPLFVGHSERFNPVVVHLRKILPGDAIRGLALRRIGDVTRAPACESVLLDLGVHDLDLVSFLTGAPVSVLDARPGATGGTTVRLSTSGGVRAHVFAQRSGLAPVRELAVRTAAGIYQGDLRNHRLTFVDPQGRAHAMLLPMTDPLCEQARELYRSLVTGVVGCVATGREGARAVELARNAENLCASSPLWYAGHDASLGR